MEIVVLFIAVFPFVSLTYRAVKKPLERLVGSGGALILAVPLGLGFLSLLIFFLGILDLLNRPVLWGLIAGLYGVSLFVWKREILSPLQVGIGAIRGLWRGSGKTGRLLLSLGGVFFLFNLIGVFIPQIGDDALYYHYALPKLFVREGGLFYFPYNYFSLSPFNIEMLYTLGMLLQGDTAANLVNALISLSLATLIYGLVRSTLGRLQGILWSVVFYSLPLTMIQTHQGYIDIGVALFAMAGFYILLMMVRQKRLDWVYFVLSGLFFGFAAGSKVFAMLSAAVGAGAFFLIHLKGESRRAFSGALLVVVVTATVASPWYIRSWFHTGNPVYPAFYHLFGGGRDWDEAADKRYHKLYTHSPDIPTAPMGRSPRGLIAAPLFPYFPRHIAGLFSELREKYSAWAKPVRDLSGYRPEVSFLTLLFIPFAWVSLRRRLDWKEPGFIVLILGIYLMAWFFLLPQVVRHLLPLFGFIYLLAGLGLKRLWGLGGFLVKTGCVAAFSLWFVTALGIHSYYYLPKAYGAVSRENFLEKNVFFYPSIKWLNANLSENSKLAIVSEILPHYLDIPYIIVGPSFRLSDYKRSGDLYDDLKKRGVTHLVVVLDLHGEYDLKTQYTNPTVITFRSDRPVEVTVEEERRSLEPLTEFLRDPSRTSKVYERVEKRILGRSPLIYGEPPIQVAVYQLR